MTKKIKDLKMTFETLEKTHRSSSQYKLCTKMKIIQITEADYPLVLSVLILNLPVFLISIFPLSDRNEEQMI